MPDDDQTNVDEANREQKLAAVIADYIRACEAGRTADRRQILDSHPELAIDLRQFFAQRDRMHQMAAPIRDFSDDLFQSVGPGQQISYVGNYELLEEVARGGMGVVYKARQVNLGRIVAVKMIMAGRLASDDDVKRFHIEAKAIAGLQHPNIVSIHEVGQHEGWHYFSMDFVSGRDLSAILRQNLLPAKQIATYVRQMAEGIHYAHQQGTLHRDLKPSNILIDGQDQVRITDFGLAMRIEGDSDLTRTGQIMGTPCYMPPEQAQGKRSLIGPGSDVYSLGAILYECLTGRAPFRADSVLKTIEQVIHVEAAPPRLLNPGVARDLETICLKCLQKEPHRRYGSAQLLADDLRRFLHGEPIVARRTGMWERGSKWIRRHPSAAGLGFVSVVATMALVGVFVGWHYNSRLETVNSDLNTAKINLERSNNQLKSGNDQLAETSAKLEIALSGARVEKSRARRYWYVSQMTLAERARKEGQIGRVMQLLRSVIPESADQEDLRGFEWHHLWRLYHGEQFRLRGHTAAVTSVVFSPDDKLLASASADKTVKLWDAVTGKELRTLEGHTASVNSIALSADGSRLISGSTDASVILWETSTGRQIKVFDGHQGPVTSVAFHPNGTRFISGSLDKTVRLWDTDTFQLVLEFRRNSCPVSGVAFSPDGQQVASVGKDSSFGGPRTEANGVVKGEALIWNSVTGEFISWLGGEDLSKAYYGACIAFSPDGKLLAVGDSFPSNTIHLFDAATGKTAKLLNANRGSVEALPAGIQQLSFSPDSRRLATGSTAKLVQIWDIESASEIYSFPEDGTCFGVAFNHSGFRIASGSDDRTVKIWDLPGNEGRTLLDVNKRRINNVAFSPDGSRIAAKSIDTAYIIDVESGVEVNRFKNTEQCGRIAWSPDASRAAVGRTIFNIASGQTIDIEDTRTVNPFSAAGTSFSPNGILLAAIGSKGAVNIWDTNTRIRTHTLDATSLTDCNLYCVAFSIDGKHLAIGGGANRLSRPGTLQIWDVSTGRISLTLDGFLQDVVAVSFSLNGKYLAAGIGALQSHLQNNPGEIRVWDVETWQEVHNFRGHKDCVYSVAFSPDNKRLASAAGLNVRGHQRQNARKHGEVKIWDLLTGQEVGTLSDFADAVFGVAFSPCGSYIATSTEAGQVRLFDGTPVSDDENSLRERSAALRVAAEFASSDTSSGGRR